GQNARVTGRMQHGCQRLRIGAYRHGGILGQNSESYKESMDGQTNRQCPALRRRNPRQRRQQ
ncbi:hypothetical protein KI387_003613, partial [Taxus chinensis]